MTGFPVVILAGFGNEVKNSTAHIRFFLTGVNKTR